jgi:hypothetical protein
MQLPIDARQAPFRDKYLDEETPMFSRWFVFGTHKFGVDVANHDGDVFINLTPEQAVRLCSLRRVFVEGVLDVLNQKR